MKDIYKSLIVGIVVLLAIFILIFGVFYLNDNDPRQKKARYYIRFSQISTLTQGDPVKINGVKLGKVEKIQLEPKGSKVIVSVNILDHVRIPKSSLVKVQNIGLMGERQISVLLSEDKQLFKPGDTLNGLFDAGIAEAMGYAGEVLDSTRVLIGIVRQIVDSTLATPDFKHGFIRILHKAESLEDRLALLLERSDPAIRESLKDLKQASSKVNILLTESEQPIREMISNTHGLTKDASLLLATVDSLTNRMMQITGKLESKDNTLGILLNDNNLHHELSITIRSADSLFKTIIDNGLDVNIDFF
jgi:phospholipid/cholesterol/gamma-HCH transport system substrate-binding protein